MALTLPLHVTLPPDPDSDPHLDLSPSPTPTPTPCPHPDPDPNPALVYPTLRTGRSGPTKQCVVPKTVLRSVCTALNCTEDLE